MDTMSLLERARRSGLEVRTDGDKLVVRGPRSAEKLAHQLLERKAEVMPLLAARPSTMSDLKEAPTLAVRMWSDILEESLLVIVQRPPGASYPKEQVRVLTQVAPGAVAWVSPGGKARQPLLQPDHGGR